MTTILVIFMLFIIAVMVLLFILGIISRSGKAPGLTGKKLYSCPDKLNCACSEDKNDPAHYIEPIMIPENIMFDILPVLKDAIRDMGGNIKAESDNYIAAVFSSGIFGFVDDLEVRINSGQKLIHIRSASRVGFYDMGVNRMRTELLKNIFNRKISQRLKAD